MPVQSTFIQLFDSQAGVALPIFSSLISVIVIQRGENDKIIWNDERLFMEKYEPEAVSFWIRIIPP